MEKLKDYLDKWFDGKKVKGVTVTPEEIYECFGIYNALARGERVTTISNNINRIMLRCQIKTTDDGIGWIIGD